MKIGWIMAMALGLLAAPVAATVEDAPFAWLVGDWRSEQGDRWTLEHWEPMRDGEMAGRSTSGKGDTVSESETMRIALQRGSAVFTAWHNGAPPVDFRETRRSAQDVTFENPQHDYPQRIRLWREGEALLAEISLADGSNPTRWRYARVK